MFKMTTAQNLELGKQIAEVWHRGQKVIRVKLVDKTYPYLFTYSNGQQVPVDAAEIVTVQN